MHKIKPNKETIERKRNKQYINLNVDVGEINGKCTCELATPKVKYLDMFSEQIYAYHETISFMDIGIGSVKTLQRRKVKKVYLPEKAERGVGSEELLSITDRKNRRNEREYRHRTRAASKPIHEQSKDNKIFLVHEKLSPIQVKRSTTTSPVEVKIEMGINTDGKELLTVTTQVGNGSQNGGSNETEGPKKKLDPKVKGKKVSKETEKAMVKAMSSDSLVQHVHDLEIPGDEKHSRTSIEPMENKLEREYRKIFATRSKDKKPKHEIPISEHKTASVFRRRFEAFRRGLLKKEEMKKNEVLIKISSQKSVISHKDVSITSDPPSLESRSLSNTKVYSPFRMYTGPEKPIYKSAVNEEDPVGKQKQESIEWPPIPEEDSEYNGVKGMFRLWGKKFNLDEDKKRLSPVPSDDEVKSKSNKMQNKGNAVLKEKREGRKFFFFKKNAKGKTKKPFQTKKSVTAARCEISDGLVIKIGASVPETAIVKTERSDDILKKQWLLKFLSHDRASTNSVRVRWNNKMYRTSSSTIFELMDNVYKDLTLRSRSEIISSDSSYCKPDKTRVKFAPQEVEAWMVARTVTDRGKGMPIEMKNSANTNGKIVQVNSKNIKDSIERLCRNIKVVLHSKNNGNLETDSSSEYVRIDIPKTFFIDSSSNDSEKQPSRDEEVYNVVEYDAVPETKVGKETNRITETGDCEYNDVQIIVSVKDSKDLESKILESFIKRPVEQRDVVVQDSTDNLPKKCDVIGVGIITQRDLGEIKKPILKIREDLSGNESEENIHNCTKKCELADTFLQQYCRNWNPLAVDLISWRISDTNVRCSSETSGGSARKQGGGNEPTSYHYDDCQTSSKPSSQESCYPCPPCNHSPIEDEEPQPESSFSEKFFKKFKKAKPDSEVIRYLPKDSFEVYRKRKLYATSNKSKWTFPSYTDTPPCSVPCAEDKRPQDAVKECPKSKKTSFQQPGIETKKNQCSKHVSIPDCETMKQMLATQMTEKKIESILTFKGAAKCDLSKKERKCPKHAQIKKQACAIPDPVCKPKCEKDPNPPCSSGSSKSDKSSPKSFVRVPTPQKEPLNAVSCKKPFQCCTPPPPCQRKCLNTPACESPPPPCEIPSCQPAYETPPCSPPSPRRKSPQKKKKPITTPRKWCPIPAPCGKPCCSNTSCRSRSISPKPLPITPPCCKKPSVTKLMPMCIHFPPCRKSQSIQISPQRCSAKNSPINTPPQSPPNKKKGQTCHVPPCSLVKEEEKKPHSQPPAPRCSTPPCRKPSPPPASKSKYPDQYPWPTKNQISNQPSLESVACPPKKPPPNKCMINCPLSPNFSDQSIKKVKSDKQCKPDCPSRPKAPTSPPSPPVCQPKASKNAFNHSKMSGVHLKKKPSEKKTCSEECLAWKDEQQQRVIRLNSRERINIRIKQQTPSTEEIRECMDIKVKDEDGDTLYERKNYRQNCPKESLLGDMYRNSNINRLSTPTSLKNLQENEAASKRNDKEKKSDMSVANLVEITFKLRVTQGEKVTEINVGKDNDNKNIKKLNNEICQVPQEVYMLNKDSETNKETGPPNDVNVRIVIKSFKPKSNVKKTEKYQKEFSKNISEKFQTVSTCYSGLSSERNPENVYSIHRTTIDLTSSNERSKANDLTDYTERVNITEPDKEGIAKKCTSKNIVSETEEKNDGSFNITRDNSSFFVSNEKVTIEHVKNQSIPETSLDSSFVLRRPCSRREQKEMLKEVLKKAKETELSDKIKIKQLKDMLQVILSDSQQHKMAVTDNELARDVTLASLPHYFNRSENESNNYNNSLFDNECSINTNGKPGCELGESSCMCNKLAEKLKICRPGDGDCCCCSIKAKNKETSCSLSNDSNVLLFNYMTEELKIDAQDSKNVTKLDSTSFLFSSNRSADAIRNENVTIVTERTDSTSRHGKRHSSNESFDSFHGARDIDDFRSADSKNRFDGHSDVIGRAKVLQSYETKRAVLRMYTKESLVNNEYLMAKLPKFSIDKENDIHKYGRMVIENYRKQNSIKLSIQH